MPTKLDNYKKRLTSYLLVMAYLGGKYYMEHVSLWSEINFTFIYTWAVSIEIYLLIPVSLLHIYVKYSLYVSLGLFMSFPIGAYEDDWP